MRQIWMLTCIVLMSLILPGAGQVRLALPAQPQGPAVQSVTEDFTAYTHKDTAHTTAE